jgi:serine/threonine-protein kinase
VILRCLSKQPADRFDSVHDLEQALRACADAGEWDDERAARWWQEIGDPPPTSVDSSATTNAMKNVPHPATAL